MASAYLSQSGPTTFDGSKRIYPGRRGAGKMVLRDYLKRESVRPYDPSTDRRSGTYMVDGEAINAGRESFRLFIEDEIKQGKGLMASGRSAKRLPEYFPTREQIHGYSFRDFNKSVMKLLKRIDEIGDGRSKLAGPDKDDKFCLVVNDQIHSKTFWLASLFSAELPDCIEDIAFISTALKAPAHPEAEKEMNAIVSRYKTFVILEDYLYENSDSKHLMNMICRLKRIQNRDKKALGPTFICGWVAVSSGTYETTMADLQEWNPEASYVVLKTTRHENFSQSVGFDAEQSAFMKSFTNIDPKFPMFYFEHDAAFGYKNPKENWFHTGMVAEVDEEGWHKLVPRDRSLIIGFDRSPLPFIESPAHARGIAGGSFLTFFDIVVHDPVRKKKKEAKRQRKQEELEEGGDEYYPY